MKAWAHLHLPRWQAFKRGKLPHGRVISLKVPGEKIRYVRSVRLVDAQFYVSDKGRARALATGRRNVHAWVKGEVKGDASVICEGLSPVWGWSRAVYDPWKGGTFVDARSFEPVHSAREVVMIGKDVYYRL